MKNTDTIIQPIIGLEVHVQLKTKSKMFCSCDSNYFGAEPNTHMCPTCAALPGALPKVNEEAIRKAIQTGIILNCTVNPYSKFERKNYFYPDLFKGYQISQYELPICTNGYVDIFDKDGKFEKRIGVIRAHLEEDTAKSIHESGRTLIDGNKAGVPLLEIVSKPDMNSAEEAEKYAKYIYESLRFVEVSNCDMEKGQLRFDINVNLLIQKGNEKFATPIVEVKNLNSFRSLLKAIEYEIKRQEAEFEETGEVLTAGNKTTRGWNDLKEETTFQRSKEEANDYRYLPDPDIPPLDLDSKFIDDAVNEMGEALDTARKSLIEQYKVTSKDAATLTRSRDLYSWYMNVVKNTKLDSKSVSNWVITEVLSILNEENVEIDNEKISPEEFAHLLDMVNGKKITSANAKEVVRMIYKGKKSVDEIVKEKGFESVSDEDTISKFADEVIQENPEVVKTILAGKESAIQFLVGQVMKKSRGAATPQVVLEIIKNKLDKLY